MRINFVALERASLIRAEIEEDNLRRRTLNLTDKGWVVHYAAEALQRYSPKDERPPHSRGNVEAVSFGRPGRSLSRHEKGW
jgi:hypothetical protein